MIKQQIFAKLSNGQAVTQYSLSNSQNVQVDILNLGGIIRRWLIPTEQNTVTDIVLGFDSLQDYLADDSYVGALIGRYANRIKAGQFSLADRQYQTPKNLNGHCLHGGHQGFNSYLWQAKVLSADSNPAIQLSLTSPDGDQGFPGQLQAKVIYTLTEQNTLKIEYFAQSDKTTVYNPTNHSYFNLAGHNSGSVCKHQIQVLASAYTPTNSQAIPTGEISQVHSTPLDLTEPTPIEQPLNSTHHQIHYANGLDHNFCLDNFCANSNKSQVNVARAAAKMFSPDGKLCLTVNTSMPGIQLFTANHFADKQGKNGALYQAHQGLCLETQFYPDSPNQPNFPSATLKENAHFYSVTEYQIAF